MHIPKVMLAAAIDRFGDADEITIQTLPLPALAPNEVMISIDIAGVGPWDAKIRAGSYPDRKPRFPLVLGIDGAGIVVAAGSRKRRLKVGDKAIHTVGRTQKAASMQSTSRWRPTKSRTYQSDWILSKAARLRPPASRRSRASTTHCM